MRAVVLLSLAAAASAFVAPSMPRTRGVARMGLADVVGYDVETGGKPWDPMGLGELSTQSKLGEPHLQYLQEAEIKNGRVAMLATVGILFTHFTGIRVPSYPEETLPLKAFYQAWNEHPLGFFQIFLLIGVIEGYTFPSGKYTGEGTFGPGEFGFDPLSFSKGKSDAVVKSFKLKEIKNGRAAMLFIAALIAEFHIPGAAPGLQGFF